jgi:hypothetical protein
MTTYKNDIALENMAKCYDQIQTKMASSEMLLERMSYSFDVFCESQCICGSDALSYVEVRDW